MEARRNTEIHGGGGGGPHEDGRPMYDSFESFCMAVIQGWWRTPGR